MLSIPHSAENGLCLAFLTLISGIRGSPVSSSLEKPWSADPIPVSVTPSFVPNVFENTHTSIIGSDGHATSVPIVGGPECWFCPKENQNNNTEGAWALLGIDSPGKYQPSAFSDFSEPFPVIFVTSDGDPVYAPSTTTDELPTNVKRVSIPTETQEGYSPECHFLNSKCPWWGGLFGMYPITGGYAMSFKSTYDRTLKIPFTDRTVTVKWPKHYGLATGFITEHHDKIIEPGCNGEPEKVILRHYLDWKTTIWDLNFDDDGTIRFRERNIRVMDLDRPNYEWKWMGRISENAKDNNQWIRNKAEELKNEMNGEKTLIRGGGYHPWLNNCRDFAHYLYKRIKY